MKHCAGISESESRGGELSDEDRCTRVVVLQVCIVRYICDTAVTHATAVKMEHKKRAVL